jgi:FMN phosphatase YigB (HAD superfamily)
LLHNDESSPRSFKVILFDLDDTLIHFDDYWKASLLETFRRHPDTKDIDTNSIFSCFMEMNQLYEKLYHERRISLRDFRNNRLIRALVNFNKEIDESTADDFNILHKNISKHFMRARPELIQLLTELKQSYSLVL